MTPAGSARVQCRFECDLSECPAALAWSSCGTWLAAATVLGSIVILEAESGIEVARWDAHAEGALALAWHPRNAVLASAGKDGCVRLWQIGSAEAVIALANVSLLDNDSRGWIEHLGWRPDGQQLAMASGSQVIVCSALGVVEQAYAFPGGTVGAIGWRPVGAQLAVAGYGGVRIYSVLDSSAKPHDLKWKGSLLSLHWSPDAKVIAAGCQDNTVHFWRLPSGKDAAMTGFNYKPLQAAWTQNGKWLVTGGSPLLILWPFDKSGPEGRSPLTIEWHEQAICAIGVAPRSGWLASACRGGRLALWRRAGDVDPHAWAALDSRVEHLQWSPRKGSALLALGSRAGMLSLWDVEE